MLPTTTMLLAAAGPRRCSLGLVIPLQSPRTRRMTPRCVAVQEWTGRCLLPLLHAPGQRGGLGAGARGGSSLNTGVAGVHARALGPLLRRHLPLCSVCPAYLAHLPHQAPSTQSPQPPSFPSRPPARPCCAAPLRPARSGSRTGEAGVCVWGGGAASSDAGAAAERSGGPSGTHHHAHHQPACVPAWQG